MVAKQLIIALVLAWAVTPAQAQIINSPAPKSTGDVRQATGDFDDAELSGGVKQVGWPNIQWPTITMPTITMPKLPSLWPSKSDKGSPALLAPFATGYSKVSAGARNAWEGTKDLFSVFQRKDGTKQVMRRSTKPKPPFWQRLMMKKQEPEVPQTVGEFMSLPRLGP